MDDGILKSIGEEGEALDKRDALCLKYKQSVIDLLRGLGNQYVEDVEPAHQYVSDDKATDKKRFGIAFNDQHGWTMHLWYGPYTYSIENWYFGCYDPKSQYGCIKIGIDFRDNKSVVMRKYDTCLRA